MISILGADYTIIKFLMIPLITIGIIMISVGWFKFSRVLRALASTNIKNIMVSLTRRTFIICAVSLATLLMSASAYLLVVHFYGEQELMPVGVRFYLRLIYY